MFDGDDKPPARVTRGKAATAERSEEQGGGKESGSVYLGTCVPTGAAPLPSHIPPSAAPCGNHPPASPCRARGGGSLGCSTGFGVGDMRLGLAERCTCAGRPVQRFGKRRLIIDRTFYSDAALCRVEGLVSGRGRVPICPPPGCTLRAQRTPVRVPPATAAF